ncbi:PP2C family serine/threonine-protein phosphatase [Halomonas alimentaria]|uniref:PPM-type phosphatase domain-containing protein n=1 Tax=Halomonas alimentaria TaxID=147248 RepID=A0A7X4W5H2_9GAMM|nr:protein phosphatase 2C domain-containing protein [Halomonas alimentaria]NAW34738.1 hypothetical protein [Halomonas alimentaria]
MSHWHGLARVCDAGSPPKNEDLWHFGDDLAFVLDGATGLGPSRLTDQASDACWFVERLADHLRQAWCETHRVENALRIALARVAEAWYARVPDNLPVEQQPSAALVLAAREGDELVMLRLGDCELYLATKHGVERVFGDSPLQALDRRAINAVMDLRQRGHSLESALTAVRPKLVAHRTLMNTPGGYSALSVAHQNQIRPDIKRVEAWGVHRMLLASDGFAAAWQAYGIGTPDTLLGSRDAQGALEALLRRLRKLECQDAEGDLFPRLKCHDDATALLLEAQA